jgi:hypothetical protein
VVVKSGCATGILRHREIKPCIRYLIASIVSAKLHRLFVGNDESQLEACHAPFLRQQAATCENAGEQSPSNSGEALVGMTTGVSAFRSVKIERSSDGKYYFFGLTQAL